MESMLEVRYQEGLYTSYRNPKKKAAFPFGHGLSFTTFNFGRASVVRGPNCSAEVCSRLTITNNGTRNGTEVVQAYLEFQSAQDTPSRVLRGFCKTRVLKPGESQD